ncbi:MAG: gluconate 2-dehydrogenase subunit 3 family protein [Maribacter sp.]|nr:gluconate 2-dehydrogenase subunit 3 family protein [Maribacter sp.]
MLRREALFLTAGMLGSTLIGTELFLTGCSRKTNDQPLISDPEILFLNEVGETILPETARSPGAKAAHIGQFMCDIVTDCYEKKEQDIFVAGLALLQQSAKNKYEKDFMGLDPSQKHDLLAQIDAEVREKNYRNEPHYFQMMKELTLWGYFTSQPGATMALRYNPIPGKYLGCVPYEPGEKAWAT